MITALLVASMFVTAEPTKVDAELLRTVVQRFEKNRELIPDHGLLPKTGAIPFRQDSFDGRAFDSSKWTVKSADAWQAEADRTKSNVYVVTVRPVEVKGDEAQLNVGVELVLPAGSTEKSLCCCNATEVYRRVGKTWRYEKSLGTVCS